MLGEEYDELLEMEAQKAHTLELERQAEELRKLLDSAGNRYWLWRLLSYSGLYRSLSISDPHEMAIRSGQRDVGLWVLNEIMTNNPNAFALMQREAKEREDG